MTAMAAEKFSASMDDVLLAQARADADAEGLTLSSWLAHAAADRLILATNGGGALVNILSVVSWFAMPLNSSYGASKSAEWALTNAVRIELNSQGTLVVGVFASFIDTEMATDIDMPKVSARSVVEQTLEAVEAGRPEVLTDDRTRTIKASLPDDQEVIYPAQQALWDARIQT
jgi:short-subunit dehydrogenase